MRILITAGPTREYIDSVRFLSNASSGKMGYALASAALKRGHDVVLISGPVELTPPDGIEFIPVISAQEMFDASVAQFERCQAAVMAAAVSDFRPRSRQTTKESKSDASRTLELESTEDICANLGASKGDRIVVGFALEDHDHRAHAEAKLWKKHCDAVVLNHVSTLTSDAARIEIFRDKEGWSSPFSGSKQQVADRIISIVEEFSCRNRTGL